MENVDVQKIGKGISETAHPIVPAIRALEEICEGGAGELETTEQQPKISWILG